jgi:hypothetical protein
MGAVSPNVFQSKLFIILSFTFGQDLSSVVVIGRRDDSRCEHKLSADFKHS